MEFPLGNYHRKRSLRRLCFYRCLSVHGGEGCAWLRGVCVVKGACMAKGGMRGEGGGMHGEGGHAWYACPPQSRLLRILLECILVR